MKLVIRIPTTEYAFAEIVVDNDSISAEQAKELYDDYVLAFKPQVGFTEKEFNKFVDEYMNTGTLKDGADLYQKMNPNQKWFFQVLKRHNKRNGYKPNEE